VATQDRFKRVLSKILPPKVSEYFESRQQASIVAKNTSWLLLERAVRLVLGVLVSAWVARYLGPTQFGQLSYVLTFIVLFQAFAGLGIDSILVRDLSRDPAHSSKYIGSALALRALAGLICWAIATLSMCIIENFDWEMVLIAAIVGSSLITQAFDVFDLWFQSQSKNKLTVIVKLTAYLLASLVKIICILAKASLVVFSAVTALEFLLVAVGLTIAFRKNKLPIPLEFSRSSAKQLLAESWPLIFATLSVALYMRVDIMMIKSILGEKYVGYYAAAVSLSNLWHVLPMSICASAAPIIALKKIEGDREYYDALLQLFRLGLITSLSISVVVFFISDFLTFILYGHEFVDTGKILKIHIFTNIPVFLGVVRSLWTVNERQRWFSIWSTLGGASLSLALNWLLLPNFGVTGAAFSAVLSYFMSAVLSSVFLSRRLIFMQLGVRTW
jgi:PST family polysaccharide transporter